MACVTIHRRVDKGAITANQENKHPLSASQTGKTAYVAEQYV